MVYFNAIDVFPIVYDVRGLRPDMIRFPRFFSMVLGVYSVTSQSKRKRHNANAGKTEHVGSKPLTSKIIGKTFISMICMQ